VPYYYSVTKTPTTPGSLFTSNGTANTKSTHLRFLTVANQQVAKIMGLFGSARFSTAGGAMMALVRGGAAGSGGTSNTPSKADYFQEPAANLTAFDDASAITPGTGPIQQQTIGFAQTGGQGGWVALEDPDAISLAPNGGANGNLEMASFASTASVTFDATVRFKEG
jgi:hypothetical protein